MTAMILGVFTTVAFGVLVVMLVTTCVSHRSRRNPATCTSSLLTELIWSTIPWLILVAAVTPSAVVILRGN
jgi:heme/copper-type cytochrome/quinol oxidase subunit 2